MKSFLLNKDNKPTVSWSQIPPNTFFEGPVPEGYFLAVCPSENIVILDVDVRKNGNGFNHIPLSILSELENTFHYSTKSGGSHYFIAYSGNKPLMNKTSKFFLDLRIGKNESTGNNGGYVRYQHNKDIRECIHLIKESSPQLNNFLESLFMGVNYSEDEKEITE
mgnify:CR=1 FL=1